MKHSFVAAALCAALPALAHAQLFGVAGFSQFGTQSLYSINPATGATTLIGSTGLRQIGDIAYDQASDQLLALTVGGDVYSLNRTTGASTLLQDRAITLPEGGFAVRDDGRRFTTIFDTLHSDTPGGWLSVGPSGIPPFNSSDVSGLTFLPGNVLAALFTNGSGFDELAFYDTATGAASLFVPTGTNAGSVAGLAYDFSAGSLLISDGSSLWRLNLDATATLLGSHGVTGMSGIAYVPTPASLGLLGLAGLLAARRRRR